MKKLFLFLFVFIVSFPVLAATYANTFISDNSIAGTIDYILNQIRVNKLVKLDALNAFIIWGGVFFYYLAIWILYGRDTHYKTVMTEYQAPKDISPEQCFLWKDYPIENPLSLMAVHLIRLQQSGFLNIESTKNKSIYYFVRTGKKPQTPAEKFFAEHMNADFVLDSKYNVDLDEYKDKLYERQGEEFEKGYTPNAGKILLGVLLFFLLIIVTPRAELRYTLWLMFFCPLLSLMVTVNKFFHFVVTLFALVMFVPTLIGINTFIAQGMYFQFVACGITAVITIPLFARILGRPTKIGAAKRAKVEGLEVFLKTLNIKELADFKKEHIEDLYPYAVALGIRNEWVNDFCSVVYIALQKPKASQYEDESE